MKKILTKLGYMAFGSLLTLIGYHFGNIDNNSANAQIVITAPEIVDEIRCRKLIIVGDDGSRRITLGTDFFDRGEIEIYNENWARRVYLGVANDDAGSLTILGKGSGGVAAGLGVDSNGGYMALWNKVLDKPVLRTGITDKGNGFILIRDKAGYQTDSEGVKGIDTFNEITRN